VVSVNTRRHAGVASVSTKFIIGKKRGHVLVASRRSVNYLLFLYSNRLSSVRLILPDKKSAVARQTALWYSLQNMRTWNRSLTLDESRHHL
jgi:hypothetical protein